MLIHAESLWPAVLAGICSSYHHHASFHYVRELIVLSSVHQRERLASFPVLTASARPGPRIAQVDATS